MRLLRFHLWVRGRAYLVHGKHNPTSNLFKDLWRIFLFGALNLDWGSGRDLCPWSESVFIRPILTEFLLGTRHHIRHPQWSTAQSSGSSQWEEWGGRRRHGRPRSERNEIDTRRGAQWKERSVLSEGSSRTRLEPDVVLGRV